MGHRGGNEPGAFGHVGQALGLRCLTHRRRIYADGEQIGPDLVVQVPREFGAFLLLQADQLGLQAAVVLVRGGEPVGHGVEADGEHRHFRRSGRRHPCAEMAASTRLNAADTALSGASARPTARWTINAAETMKRPPTNRASISPLQSSPISLAGSGVRTQPCPRPPAPGSGPATCGIEQGLEPAGGRESLVKIRETARFGRPDPNTADPHMARAVEQRRETGVVHRASLAISTPATRAVAARLVRSSMATMRRSCHRVNTAPSAALRTMAIRAASRTRAPRPSDRALGTAGVVNRPSSARARPRRRPEA